MKGFGPGFLVTAAFIGPGSIATASVAGANFGFVLLWALLFSLIATIVLQEMAARLGLVSGSGLSQALRSTFSSPIISRCAVVLVVSAIGVGNAAYEAGWQPSHPYRPLGVLLLLVPLVRCYSVREATKY